MLSSTQLGQMAFHVLQMDYHRPFIDGKANRANIEEQIVIGAYSGEIPPIDQTDVDIIIDLVDGLISDYGVKQ